MPQITPLLELVLVCTWYEEPTSREQLPDVACDNNDESDGSKGRCTKGPMARLKKLARVHLFLERA